MSNRRLQIYPSATPSFFLVTTHSERWKNFIIRISIPLPFPIDKIILSVGNFFAPASFSAATRGSCEISAFCCSCSFSYQSFCRKLFFMLLLSAKLQIITISLSATPINRRCGFLFGKVSPTSRPSFIGCPPKRENGRHEMGANVYFKPQRDSEYGKVY